MIAFFNSSKFMISVSTEKLPRYNNSIIVNPKNLPSSDVSIIIVSTANLPCLKIA